MGYQVQLTNQAKKQLAALEKKTLALVASFIDRLDGCDDPSTFSNAKKLQGIDDGWRWRVGSYRILGTICDDKVIIELFRIGHRRDIYRRLSK